MTRPDSFTWKLYLVFAWLDRLIVLGLLGLWLTDVIALKPAAVLIFLIAFSNVFIAAIWVDPVEKRYPKAKK